MVCHKCGEDLNEGINICPNCGEVVENGAENNYFNAKVFGIIALILAIASALALIGAFIVVVKIGFNLIGWLCVGLCVALIVVAMVISMQGIKRANKNVNREFLTLNKMALLITAIVMTIAILIVLLFGLLIVLKTCASCA